MGGDTGDDDEFAGDRDGPTYGRAARLAFALLVLVGIGARVSSYLGDRSLFTDEASLALKVCGQSYAELPRPYGDGGIVAPLGFLASLKACVDRLGFGNGSLRLIPFVAGLATFPVFFALCRGGLGGPAAAPGLALLGVSTALVYHGAEVKQYSSDAFLTAVILLATSGAFARPRSPARLAILAIVGLVVPWFSHPSIFVTAAVATELVVGDLRARRFGPMAAHALIGLLWAASFAVAYRFSKSMVGPTFPFDDFWEFAYLNVPPGSAGDLANYIATFLGFFEVIHTSYTTAQMNGIRLAVACAVAWAVGVHALAARGRRPMLRVALLMLGYAAIAGALHRYPLRGRLLVFSIPLTLLVMTAGLDRLLRSPARDARVVGWALFWGVSFLPSLACLEETLRRPTRQEVESVLREVARRWRPGDSLYLHVDAVPIYRFDATYRGVLDEVPPGDLILGRPPDDPFDAGAYASEIAPLLGRGRVWVVMTNFEFSGQLSGANRFQLGVFDRLGRRAGPIVGGRSAWAFLYDFGDEQASDRPGSRPASRGPSPRRGRAYDPDPRRLQATE